MMRVWVFAVGVSLCCLLALGLSAFVSTNQVGVVCNIKVVSDKVPDVSSLEAWRRSFIKPGMSDEEKALAIWRSVVMFRHQDSPPKEFLEGDGCVHDPIKVFNVYGYNMCCCAASNIAALARFIGLPARIWTIRTHVVPEVRWDGVCSKSLPSCVERSNQ